MPKDNDITGDGEFYMFYLQLYNSKAVKTLSGTALKAFLCILMTKNLYDDHDTFTFTFEYAKMNKICSGSDTFVAIKKILVLHGLIDQVLIGGMKVRAKFKLSNRWRLYGEEGFEVIEYKPGISNDNLSEE